jgi:hypothetical protein
MVGHNWRVCADRTFKGHNSHTQKFLYVGIYRLKAEITNSIQATADDPKHTRKEPWKSEHYQIFEDVSAESREIMV